MDRKELYKKALLEEYRNMHRALCRMTSYYEKLTTDGFDLDEYDKDDIQSVVNKVDTHFTKHVNSWLSRAKEYFNE